MKRKRSFRKCLVPRLLILSLKKVLPNWKRHISMPANALSCLLVLKHVISPISAIKRTAVFGPIPGRLRIIAYSARYLATYIILFIQYFYGEESPDNTMRIIWVDHTEHRSEKQQDRTFFLFQVSESLFSPL